MSNPDIYKSYHMNDTDYIRKKGCTWIVNGNHCKLPCVPFLYVCNEHKNIPDIPRHTYSTAASCRKRK